MLLCKLYELLFCFGRKEAFLKFNDMNRNKILFLFLFLIATEGIIAQAKYGQNAYEVALPSVNGDTIKLSSLKGKVILLDFWASWCPPCRASNKRLTKLYPKYRDKGFEILGVSIDDDAKDWKRAILKDKISWLQVMDKGGWDSPSAVKWNLNAVPTSYLINKEGMLVAMDLDGKELEKALNDLLEK